MHFTGTVYRNPYWPTWPLLEMHDIDTWIFFKWIFKTFVAVLLVTNTWQIISSIFQIGNNLVTQAAGTINTTVGIDTM